MRMRATAIAHPNLALVKYWGKRDIRLNLPAAGSLSVTLSGLRTQTSVAFIPGQARDAVILNGRAVWGPKLDRIVRFLDHLRRLAGTDLRATVNTENDFPTAAGLASSSSGFAALAAAGAAALGLELTAPELSVLARLGSGSAARSIHGGFVEMLPGVMPDGSDSHAVPVAYENHWDLRCLILLTAKGETSIGSTEAMNHTASSSPYYRAWVESVPHDLALAREAIRNRDMKTLAVVAERSCLRMHASAAAADPGILFWNGTTIELIHHIRKLRSDGFPVFFTIDAGPHVKVFCSASEMSAVTQSIRSVFSGDIIVARPGPGVYLKDEPERR